MRGPSYESRWWHSATAWLLIANVVVFALASINSAYVGLRFVRHLALIPEELFHGHIYQLLTFQFLHGGFLHLFLNCVMLFMLGRQLEPILGRNRFLEVYLASGVLGGIIQGLLGVVFPNAFGMATVGASAGVAALLAVFCTLEPDQTLYVQFILPIRARYLLYGSLAISAFFILVPVDPGVAHGAHLGGLLGGMAYVHWILRRDRSLLNLRPYSAVERPRELARANAGKAFWKKQPVHREDTSTTDDLPPSEFISREVDPILDKISAHGIQSLTERERRILDAARRKMAKR